MHHDSNAPDVSELDTVVTDSDVEKGVEKGTHLFSEKGTHLFSGTARFVSAALH